MHCQTKSNLLQLETAKHERSVGLSEMYPPPTKETLPN